MRDAGYYRAWRRDHPDYRRREVDRTRRRRAVLGREDRVIEYRNRRSRAVAVEPIPSLHRGHELFDRARAIVGPARSGLTILLDPLHEDLLSVATLALLEGRDAIEAVRRFRASETAWRRITGPIAMELAA